MIGKETDKLIRNSDGHELAMRGFVAHEYVHAVAVSIIGDRDKGIPGWAVEGSANFYGFAIAALMAEQPVAAMNRVNVGNLRRSYSEQGALVPNCYLRKRRWGRGHHLCRTKNTLLYRWRSIHRSSSCRSRSRQVC